MKQKYKLTARFGPYGYLIPSILVFAVFLFYPFFINDKTYSGMETFPY